FKRLDSITDEERDNKEDYVTLMNDNIDLLKNTLYQ
ncbi:MAG TPA: cell division protein ZapA, partial [Candidatus Faecenecus gallistercoris]|nr:cell division protein ZapA [Candidatus Faecenecus gallistercoris]